MKYLLDTNICIYIIKKHPENVLKKFTSLKIDDVCLSSITVAELMFGMEKSLHKTQNKAALEEFLAPFNVIPFDEETAAYYGSIRAHLEKKGALIGALDMMIAAHAEQYHLTLVTNNKREFLRVPHLKVEDWVHHE